MGSATKACLEIAQQRVNPAELGQIIGVLTTCDDGLMAAACRSYRAEAGQAIGEHLTTRGQSISCPGADRLRTEPRNRRDCGVKRMPCLVQGNGSNDDDLVFRSSTCLAAQTFSSEAGIIHLDLSPQHIGLPLTHSPQDLVVEQQGRVIVHIQMAAEFEGGGPVFRLPDSIESLRSCGQRQFSGLHNRA